MDRERFSFIFNADVGVTRSLLHIGICLMRNMLTPAEPFFKTLFR